MQKEKRKIAYQDHVLELEFSFAAWKVQGLTYDCAIICIGSQKTWAFKNLCVVFSRVKTNEGIRYLPLSKDFNSSMLLNKLPIIWTTR